MTCAEALDLVEAVASGDVDEQGALAAHVASCRSCAAALHAATAIERALAMRETPAAPEGFTAALMARIRRERWRHEQQVDRAFNVSIAAGVMLAIGAAVSLLNLSTVVRVFELGADALGRISLESPGLAPRSTATLTLPAVVLAIAFGVWWWAERRDEYSGQDAPHA